jgi:hypothetical protein
MTRLPTIPKPTQLAQLCCGFALLNARKRLSLTLSSIPQALGASSTATITSTRLIAPHTRDSG